MEAACTALAQTRASPYLVNLKRLELHLISPYNIALESDIKVSRVKDKKLLIVK